MGVSDNPSPVIPSRKQEKSLQEESVGREREKRQAGRQLGKKAGR